QNLGVRVLTTPVRTPMANGILREADRHDPARMFGLADPCRRGAPPADSAGVGDALQSWTTALIPRTWDSGTAPSQGSGQRPPTRAPEGLSRRLKVSARRLTS